MMVSTKGRYALRVMLDLAANGKDTCVSLRDIANRQEISLKYLEAVIAILNRAGLVTSRMGKNGGYQLARPPKDYTIWEILKATEGALAPVSCLECDKNTCGRAKDCLTLPMWQELDHLISGYLRNITLDELSQGKINFSEEEA